MAAGRNPVPNYRRHKPTGQAVVTVRTADGRRKDVYLGPYGSPKSKEEYRRLIARIDTPGAISPAADVRRSLTVAEVLLAFLKHADAYYRRPDGTRTDEPKEFRLSARPVRELFATLPADEFGPKALKAVRDRMVAAGLCRTLVNRRVGRVRHVFKWAASEELVPGAVAEALKSVGGLTAGRTDARESEPVAPVPVGVLDATLPHLPRVPRAMAEVQRWTGMRPGEVCRLTLAEIDRAGPVWIYTPSRHKTRHRGKGRAVAIGPRGQAALLAFLAGRTPAPIGVTAADLATPVGRIAAADRYSAAHRPVDAALLRDLGRPVVLIGGAVVDPTAGVFSPARDRAERFAAARAARKSKVTPSQRDRRVENPDRVPGDWYSPHAYATAVQRACEAAGVPHWHPNQIRHAVGTAVREEFGLEAAQVFLGHARADVTQVYAERDLTLAVKVAAEAG